MKVFRARNQGLGARGALTLLCSLSLGVSLQAAAQTQAKKDDPADTLQEVVVTGSLIPQVQKETAQPLTVITFDDIQKKGFTSVADALQHTSFATGGIQNGQFSGGFTPGAEVLSLFGLAPGYTKYLIDGRPIADYPALYRRNGCRWRKCLGFVLVIEINRDLDAPTAVDMDPASVSNPNALEGNAWFQHLPSILDHGNQQATRAAFRRSLRLRCF